MRMTKESLRRIVREAVKAKLSRLDEGLINDLEKSSGVAVRPGRNVLWGYPVDIEDGDATQGIDMRAVDRDASVGLLKRLRQSGFKARFDKATGTIGVDAPDSMVGESIRSRLSEGPKPPPRTNLASRAAARAAAQSPEVMEAVDVMVGAIGSALMEMIPGADPDVEMEIDQSVHTEFHNDLMKFVEDWMSTYTEAYERGDLGTYTEAYERCEE